MEKLEGLGSAGEVRRQAGTDLGLGIWGKQVFQCVGLVGI